MGRKQYSVVGWLTQETGRPVGQQEAGHFKALWPWSEKALKFSGAKYSVKEDRERWLRIWVNASSKEKIF